MTIQTLDTDLPELPAAALGPATPDGPVPPEACGPTDEPTVWVEQPARPRRRHHGVTRPTPPPPVRSGPVVSAGDLVQQTALAVRSLTLSVNRFRAAIADAMEISPTDVLALTEVSLSARLTPGELADRVGVGVAGTSTVIDKLVRAGFLRRTPSTTDRRTYTISLTPAGVHAVGWISDVTRAAITDAHSALADNPPLPAHPNAAGRPADAGARHVGSTVAHLDALSAAYYLHADTLALR